MPIEERTIVDLREEMALKALDDRYTVTEVAAMYDVSRPTVRHWRDRLRAAGRAGLTDRSHATRSCPHRTAEEVEALIVAERKRWGWGSKKILSRLQEHDPALVLPARSTVDGILSRHGLVRRRRRRGGQTPFRRRYDATEPGELTTIDHKGEFRLRNGTYCYPLTMVDSVSRYVLACVALDSTSLERAWPVIERVFRDHGLPRAMQSDNGPPFGSPNGKFSRLSVMLMSLGVQPVFGRPGVPQDNACHERMHRDLKDDTTRPPGRALGDQQKRFDDFVHRYNVERPHEGIGMQRPARLYSGSGRPYPRRRPTPEYELHWEPRLVNANGQISWRQRRIFVGHALSGQTLGLESTDDQLWAVHFFEFKIGDIDERTHRFI